MNSGGTGVFFILRHVPAEGVLEVWRHVRLACRLGRRVPSHWVGLWPVTSAGDYGGKREGRGGYGVTRVPKAKGTGLSLPIDGRAAAEFKRAEDRVVGSWCRMRESPVPRVSVCGNVPQGRPRIAQKWWAVLGRFYGTRDVQNDKGRPAGVGVRHPIGVERPFARTASRLHSLLSPTKEK